MLFGLSKSAEKTPCLNKKWYQGSICLDTKIIFKTENNIKNQGSACTKKKKIFFKTKNHIEDLDVPSTESSQSACFELPPKPRSYSKRFPFSFCWLLLQILKYGHKLYIKVLAACNFLENLTWPRKKCSRLEFHRLPELCALWDQNPRKQSKPTPLQLWKFCKMKTKWKQQQIELKQKFL